MSSWSGRSQRRKFAAPSHRWVAKKLRDRTVCQLGLTMIIDPSLGRRFDLAYWEWKFSVYLGGKWIPYPSTYSIQSPCRILQRDAKVSELIEPTSSRWNIPLIREIFWEEEADLICGLPLSRYNMQDRLIWKCTSSGEFSVRSAYHLELERNAANYGGGSKQSDYNAIWKNIWNLTVSNATKVFIWRACSNILPTKENLKNRGVLEDAICILCTREVETIAHALWHCPAAQDVWRISAHSLQKNAIWKRRNEVTHGGLFKHPVQIAQDAMAQWKSWDKSLEQQENVDVMEPSVTAHQFRWKAPADDMFKANWDVSVKSVSRRFGVSIIVRDSRGRYVQPLAC
ncbi:uncharacterized protein LOC132187949 [Corylus avellana]|uniref:uncharacterized protein LOC132187949 n=1 Tax=Corylus avellana TaxID=13451 RepID=UPI00286D5D83|nr:uncharacterized protein LOC132187949 [Corylus avellana]